VKTINLEDSSGTDTLLWQHPEGFSESPLLAGGNIFELIFQFHHVFDSI